MSLFGSFNPVNIIKKVISNPVKAVSGAILTGGVSLVSPQIAKIVEPITSLPYNPKLIPAALSLASGNPAGAVTTAGGAWWNSGAIRPGQVGNTLLPVQGGQPMALNLGGILNQVGQIFGGSDIGAFQTIGQVANLGAQFVPQPVSYPQGSAQQTMAMVPAIRAGVALTRDVFDAGSKVLGRLGIPFGASTGSFTSALKRALGSVASLARRTPAGTLPNLLIGLGLTSLEAYLLTAWHAQRKRGRRMNPANSRALRRAARRIKSFHKLCVHTDVLKSRGRRVGVASRCGTCRKSPCRC